MRYFLRQYLGIAFYNFAKGKDYTFYSLKIFGCSVFAFHNDKGLIWFRLFGKGYMFKDILRRELIFSERNNARKDVIYIGKWLIRPLK